MSKKHINELMEELEEENKYMMVDGEQVSLREIIDRVLNKDKEEEKRKLGDG